MTNSNPRLLLRKHTYYIRVAIPRHIQYLAKRKEYRYSLDTKDYYAVLSKLRAESFKTEAMRDQKNQEIANVLTTHTKWEDVYEDMVRPAKHSKSVKIAI